MLRLSLARHAFAWGVAAAAVLGGHPHALSQPGDERPSVTLRASPAVAFAPARIVLSANVLGGADDFEGFYCPTIEWDWGDGTTSSSQADCAPYEARKSQIRRRYTVEHIYRQPGAYRIFFRLKKNTRVSGIAQANVQVRAGLP